MRPTLHRLLAVALSALALVSCSTDAPTAVPHLQQSPPQEASQDLLGLSSLLGMNGLQRTRALAAPITVGDEDIDALTVAVTAAATCAWTAPSNAGWLDVISGSAGRYRPDASACHTSINASVKTAPAPSRTEPSTVT